MKQTKPPNTPRAIETQTMRELLIRISDAALSIEFESALEQATKLTSLIVNLTKTIRETEIHNEKIANAAKDSKFKGTLEERLRGFSPTPEVEAVLRAELKEHLVRLGPRLEGEPDENA